jgi:DNA-binding CsgD family transcriptional regulator
VSTQSFIVLEAAAHADFDRVRADLAARGLTVSPAFEDAAPGMACAAEVRDSRTAQQAVLAALAGAHLVVLACATREVIDMLCEDLRRLGVLDHRLAPEQSAEPRLTPAERALVERLLAGDSLGEAAKALHLSRRTADRRLASARRTLGAATTAEALAIAVQAGLRPPHPPA